MTYLGYIILLVVVCTIAAILDHVSGMDKPKKKPYKPKKKNFFVRWGETGCKYYW